MSSKTVETYGVFWNISYLHEHIGDGVYMGMFEKGAKEIGLNSIKDLLLAKEISDEKNFYHLLSTTTDQHFFDAINLFDWLDENQKKHDAYIHLSIESEVVELDRLVDNSYFTIRKCSASEIESAPTLSTNTTYS